MNFVQPKKNPRKWEKQIEKFPTQIETFPASAPLPNAKEDGKFFPEFCIAFASGEGELVHNSCARRGGAMTQKLKLCMDAKKRGGKTLKITFHRFLAKGRGAGKWYHLLVVLLIFSTQSCWDIQRAVKASSL